MSEIRANPSSPTVVLIERGERFFVYEPTLNIIASDDTVEGAYRKYAGIRRQFSDDIQRAGVPIEAAPAQSASLRWTGQPVAPVSPRSIVAELGIFLAKTCIVLLFVGAVGIVAANGLARAAERVVTSVGDLLAPLQSLSLADVVRKAADMARDAEDLPEEKRNSLRRSVGILSRETGPIADAWRNPPTKTESTTQPAPTNTGR